MLKPLTADDLFPLVACLTPQERSRLLRLIASATADASLYESLPPTQHEFSTDEEALAWDSDGWENIG